MKTAYDNYFIKMLDDATGLPMEGNKEFMERFNQMRQILFPNLFNYYQQVFENALDNAANEYDPNKHGSVEASLIEKLRQITCDILFLAAFREASMSTIFQILEGQYNPKPRKSKLRLVK